MRRLLLLAPLTLASSLENLADICFFRHLEGWCDPEDKLPYICCENVPSGACCQNDLVPGYCVLMHVAGFVADNPTVNFYKNKNCKGLFDDCTMDKFSSILQSNPANCCSAPWKKGELEYPAGEGELKVCSAHWVADFDDPNRKQKIERGDEGSGNLTKRDGECRRPDVIKFADQHGTNRTITTVPEKVWRVINFIDRREWEALDRWYKPQAWYRTRNQPGFQTAHHN